MPSEDTPTKPEEHKFLEGSNQDSEPTNIIEGGKDDIEELKCPNVQVFVNCTGLGKDIRNFNEKMFHEMQFDQVKVSLGKQMLGFTLLMNYFTRIHAHL